MQTALLAGAVSVVVGTWAVLAAENAPRVVRSVTTALLLLGIGRLRTRATGGR